MERADWHTFQVLTKRSERMRDLLQGRLGFAAALAAHLVGRERGGPARTDCPASSTSRSAPAGLRMLSVEPLLEDLGRLDLAGIGWVIAGGESGPGARPMDREWVASIRDQCQAAGVPFFFKQWGGTRKGRAGRTLDGRTHDEVPHSTPRSFYPTQNGSPPSRKSSDGRRPGADLIRSVEAGGRVFGRLNGRSGFPRVRS